MSVIASFQKYPRRGLVRVRTRELDRVRVRALEHVALWAQANNLKLNRAKTVKAISTDSRHMLPATSIRMLGVTLSNHLSVSDHIRDVISRCAQSLHGGVHTLKIMRCHGMNSDALKTVYKSVVLAKLLHAPSVWWGFATSSDEGRIAAHVRRAVRLNLYHDTDPTVSQLAEDADGTLFENILADPQHVLHHLLPSRTQHSYKLRLRHHDCSLTVKCDARNIITRQLFKDMY